VNFEVKNKNFEMPLHASINPSGLSLAARSLSGRVLAKFSRGNAGQEQKLQHVPSRFNVGL
jgi:hypothetical protein